MANGAGAVLSIPREPRGLFAGHGYRYKYPIRPPLKHTNRRVQKLTRRIMRGKPSLGSAVSHSPDWIKLQSVGYCCTCRYPPSTLVVCPTKVLL